MDFIEKCKQKHGDKYLYTKTNYLNSKTKIEIICPEHGSFFKNHIHISVVMVVGNATIKSNQKKQNPRIYL